METKFVLVGSFSFLAVVALAGCTLGQSKPMVINEVPQQYCSSNGTLVSTPVIQSHRSYCMQSRAEGNIYQDSKPVEYAFSITDDQGTTLKDFMITHTKPMHVIVARKDLNYFQHVHPEFNQSTGIFTLSDFVFPADGQYRVFADFAAAGGQRDSMGMPLTTTIFEDVQVGATYLPQPIGSQERSKIFEGYQVTLETEPVVESGKETMLTFDLKQDGKTVTDLQEYLGELGHTVILREGNLDFIHAHPVENVTQAQIGKVNFIVNFPEAGIYKAFTQFQRDGKVLTTNFVLTVQAGQDNGTTIDSGSMSGMDHSMMGH